MDEASTLDLLREQNESATAAALEQANNAIRSLAEAVRELRASQGRHNEILLCIAEMLQVAIVPDLTTEDLPSLRILPGINTKPSYRPEMFVPSRRK